MSVSCIVSFEESKFIRPEAFTSVASLREYADGDLWKMNLDSKLKGLVAPEDCVRLC